MSNHDIHFEPKFKNRRAMEIFQPPMVVNFSRCHLLLKVLRIHQNLSNIKLQSTQQFITLTLMAMIGMQSSLYKN